MPQKGNILIIDDNKQILDSLRILLKTEFSRVETIRNPNLIPEKLRAEDYDVILLDMNFTASINSGNEGIYWLKEILKIDPLAVVILITAYGDIELAVKAIKEGATDFITKPWDAEKLLITLNTACKLRESKLQVNHLKDQQQQLTEDINRHYTMVTGSSPSMKKVYDVIDKVACTDANVLILGENGTGKELIAREIHRKSNRAKSVFIGVDMTALSETLFESEMFGHVKGAFTDAREDRSGRFETASGGTLFLDEIGNLPLSIQSKLLTALQNREVYRLGSNRAIPVDIRLITATNKNISGMVEQHLFREDLLYRINTIQIDRFLQQYSNKYGKFHLKISPDGYEKLINYRWPGNVRELKHTMEKMVILSDSGVLTAGDFYFGDETSGNLSNSLKLSDIEKRAIASALEKSGGNIVKAAKLLNISRTTLYSKIEKYNLNG